MSDSLLNTYLHYGTSAARAAFVPDPPVVGGAVVPVLYVWRETDTGNSYVYDTAWHAMGGGGTPGGSSGQVQYNNSSAFGGITNGASGTVLTSTGTGTAPTFQALPGAGGGIGGAGLILLEEHTASASASLNFTTGMSSTYDQYLLLLQSLIPGTGGSDCWIRVSTNGGSTWDSTSNYFTFGTLMTNTLGSPAAFGAGSAPEGLLATSVSASWEGVSGQIALLNPSNASVRKHLKIDTMWTDTAPTGRSAQGGLIWGVNTAYNAVQVLFSAGTIASGIGRLYGYTK